MADKKKLPKPLVNFKGFLKDKGTFPAVNKKEVAKKLLKKGFRMTLGRTAQGAGIALVGGSIASMVANKIKKMKKKKMEKPKKKMGGGMMQRPMGYDKGGSSFMDDIVDNMGKDYDNALNKEMSKEIRNRQKVNKRDGSVETAEYDIDHNKMESNAANKVKKKYGFDKGGMARGMGAAIKGGKFQGVF